MRHLIASLGIVLSSTALADAPIASAIAVSRVDSHEWVLSREQVGALDRWLKEHRNGWRANVATPPAAALSINTKQSDGTERSIEFFDQPGWAGSIIIHGRIASFLATDIASLRQQLGDGVGK